MVIILFVVAAMRNEKSEDEPELNVCFIKIHELGVDVEQCDTLSLFHREILKAKTFAVFLPIFVKSVFLMLSKRKHEYSTAHFALKCDTLSLFHREMLKTKQTFAGFSSYFPEINISDAQKKEHSSCYSNVLFKQMAPDVPTNNDLSCVPK